MNPGTHPVVVAAKRLLEEWGVSNVHEERFADNTRMSMMMRNVARLDDDPRRALRSRAASLRDDLGIGPVSG